MVNIKNKKERILENIIKQIKTLDFTLIVPVLLLVVLWIIIGIKNPRFISFFGFKRIITTAVPLLICAFGVSHVIRLGSIDLSIEGQVGFSSILISYLFTHGINNYFLAIVITLIAATLFGLLNGIIYTKIRIPSFLSSMALGYICLGIGNYIYKGKPIVVTNKVFRSISLGSFLNLQNSIIIIILMFIILFYLQKKTTLGLYINAVGENEKLSILNGIMIDKTKIFAFSIAGFCYGLAGLILTSRLGSGISNIGTGLLMNSIAAVIIGGTPMAGGSGGVFKTLIGGLIIVSLQTLIIIFRVNPFYQDAVIGLVLIVAILFSMKKGLLVIAK